MAKLVAVFLVCSCLLGGIVSLFGAEPFRTFHTAQGHKMVARLIGYQGQVIFLEDQTGRRYQLEFRLLSQADGQYCIDAVKRKRIPAGVPPANVPAPGPGQTPPAVPTQPNPPDPTPVAPTPQPAPSPLRPGSFFSHKAAPLGEDPAAFAQEEGGMPAAGEPIDFKSHVLPILKSRCLDCHGAPFVKNGRTITAKAGLRLDTYEFVVKGTLDGPVLKPGSLEDSYLYELITLDEDDADVMPPKGGKLTPEQIDVFKRWIEEGLRPSAGNDVAGAGGLPRPGQPVDYEKHLRPIFADRCLSCHGEPYVKNGRTINPKAGLRLDTYEMISKGTLDGPVVVPKNPAESAIYILVNPEESDETDIMPPKGDPLSPEQVDAIKRWILEGALAKAAATAADPNAPVVAAPVALPTHGKASPLDPIAKRVRPLGKPQLQAAEKTGALVRPLAKNHPLVRVEFVSNAPSIDDSVIQKFSNIRNNVSHMDLGRTNVSDRGVALLRSFYNLTWLSLRNTNVGDGAIDGISRLQSLWYLNLVGTKVTDKGLHKLAAIKTLREIYLWSTDVSDDGVAMLQKALPDAKIIFR